MDTAPNDLQAIRRILADLTSRIYRIEQKLGLDQKPDIRAHTAPAPPPSPPQPEATAAISERPSPPVSAPPYVPTALKVPYNAQPQAAPLQGDLESRIGSHWLNRIGIAALLIGVSYFLKFAFDNNWIGPAGRVTIGLLAGIGVVSWSERFRTKGY